MIEENIIYDKDFNEIINKNLYNLKNNFEKIKKMHYIKGMYKGYGNAGRTFETLLGITNNTFDLPDFATFSDKYGYVGIEIKTKSVFNKNPINLFSAVPDGETFFETKRLVNTYGYPNHYDKKFLVLYGIVYGNKKNYIEIKYSYKLNIDYKNKKLILEIYNRSGKLIDNKTCWSFELIKEKLERKLRVLALVNVYSKIKNNECYFWYSNMDFYKFKDFDIFLKLIEEGIITISFKVGMYTDEKRYGKIYDHGTTFQIQKKNLWKLYTKHNWQYK